MKNHKDRPISPDIRTKNHDPVTILIVDDETLSREALKEAVDYIEGMIVVGEADTVKEAVDKINKLHPEILLLDYYLPDGYGPEIARLTGMELNSIIISAMRQLDELMKQMGLPFITKPVSIQMLESAFKTIINSRRLAP